MLLVLNSCLAQTGKSSDRSLGDGLFARITTPRGDILLSLEYEKAPLTVCNFAALAEGKMTAAGGKAFYDGLSFHRVVENFIIQGGDPLGDGLGGPGYKFPDEIDPTLKHDSPGILSMANAGPATNGSQFFITHVATPWLDGRHTVFGRVVQGQDVVNVIQQGDKIEKITIIRNGAKANAFKTDQAAFDSLLRNNIATADARLKVQRDADLALIDQNYPNANVSPSGLRWMIEKTGNGPRLTPGSTAVVRLKGTLLNGSVFIHTDMLGGPRDFPVGAGKLLPGFEEALSEMSVGEKRTVIIPPELAYGEKGAAPHIPPNGFLVYEIEVLEVK